MYNVYIGTNMHAGRKNKSNTMVVVHKYDLYFIFYWFVNFSHAVVEHYIGSRFYLYTLWYKKHAGLKYFYFLIPSRPTFSKR